MAKTKNEKLLSFNEIEKLIEDEIENVCSEQRFHSEYYTEEDKNEIISMIKNKKKWILGD